MYTFIKIDAKINYYLHDIYVSEIEFLNKREDNYTIDLDRNVILNTSWMMYKSSKSKDLSPYILTHLINCEGIECNTDFYTDDDLIKLLSLRTKKNKNNSNYYPIMNKTYCSYEFEEKLNKNILKYHKDYFGKVNESMVTNINNN